MQKPIEQWSPRVQGSPSVQKAPSVSRVQANPISGSGLPLQLSPPHVNTVQVRVHVPVVSQVSSKPPQVPSQPPGQVRPASHDIPLRERPQPRISVRSLPRQLPPLQR